MIVPFVCPAKLLKCFTPEKLAEPHQCMCGRTLPLGSVMVAWTHAHGSEDMGWFVVCNQACFTARITEGNA